MIQEINYFYFDETKNTLVLNNRGWLYGANSSIDTFLSFLAEAYGRSVNGSKELFAKVNKAHQKLGVLVNPDEKEIYFPTHASNNSKCVWINCGKVYRFKPTLDNQCMIEFKDGTQITVTCSARVVSRQMKRCLRVLDSLVNPYEYINDTFTAI